MATPTLRRAVGRLVIAGEQAGFSVQQTIDLFNDGMSVEKLLDLIAQRLQNAMPSPSWNNSSSASPRVLGRSNIE